ncbi:CapA family protein, partial [Kibdelosporangium lantanae]
PYAIPHAFAEVYAVFTNVVPLGAQRGSGRAEATYFMERLLDRFAAEIGKDPAEVRLQNMVPPTDFPYDNGLGWTYDSGDYPTALKLALENVGYDDCSTASNHTLDQGYDGVKQTLDTLDKAGVKHTGSARSAEEARKPLIVDVHGIKVGHVSFAFGFNGHKVPANQPWLANTIDADDVIAAA